MRRRSAGCGCAPRAMGAPWKKRPEGSSGRRSQHRSVSVTWQCSCSGRLTGWISNYRNGHHTNPCAWRHDPDRHQRGVGVDAARSGVRGGAMDEPSAILAPACRRGLDSGNPEIRYGIRILPQGRRRDDLQYRFDRFVSRGFAERVLDFDWGAASLYGEIMGSRREIGRPMSVVDGQIAAVARARGCQLATRNVTDFEACGVELVNPWAYESEGQPSPP